MAGRKPSHGYTKAGKAVHADTSHYAHETFSRFNAKLAVKITGAVGTMTCAYLFALLTLTSAPAKFSEGIKGIIEWVAQTFLQLVLLSIILVGQKVQGAAADARAERTLEDAEHIKAEVIKAVELLRLDTDDGLAVVNQKIDQLAAVKKPATKRKPAKPQFVPEDD